MTLWEILRMRPGGERRRLIVEYINNSEFKRLAVNRKWLWQTKKDRDIRKLLKLKVLKMDRIRCSSSGKSNQTILILNSK